MPASAAASSIAWRCRISPLLSVLLILLTLPSIRPAPSPSARASPPSSPSSSAAAPSLSIDAVALLLPPPVLTLSASYAVSHIIRAYGDCFHWTNSDPHLVSLIPVPSSACSSASGQRGFTAVTVTPTQAAASPPSSTVSTASVSSRRTVWLYAEALSSSSASSPAELLCELFIDSIASVSILTSTRRVNTGEEETLQLQGFDAAGNVFSSLEGLSFSWRSSNSEVLELLRLTDAGLNVSARLLELEAAGVSSSLVAARGVTSGKATVSAVMAASPPSLGVNTSVELIVLEPLLLQPRHARIAPAASFTLLAFTRTAASRGKTTSPAPLSTRRRITFPSSQYAFSLSSPASAGALLLSPSDGAVTGLAVGSGGVELTDRNFEEHREKAEVEVADLASVSVEMLYRDRESGDEVLRRAREGVSRQQSEWWICQGSDGQLVVLLRDPQGRLMDFTPNTLLAVQLRGDSISSATSSLSSLSPPSSSAFSALDFRADRAGQAVVTLSLSSISHPPADLTYRLPSPIRHPVHITVTLPVSVSPPSLLLPVSLTASAHPLTVAGGSGNYTLVSSSPAVTVAQHSVTALSASVSTVTVTDARDPHNSASAAVEAADVGRLRVAKGRREAEVGSEVELVVLVTAADGRRFDSCSELRLKVEQAGAAFEVDEQSLLSSTCQPLCHGDESAGCWRIRMRAVRADVSSITASVPGLAATLSAPVTFSAFVPASLSSSHYIAAPSSPITVRLRDGPLPLPEGAMPSVSVSAYRLSAELEQWAEEEKKLKRVWEEGQQLLLPSLLARTEKVQVRRKEGEEQRETEIVCEDGAEGEYVLVADVAHSVSSALPSPLHSGAFARLSCQPPLLLSPSSLSLGIGEKQRIDSLIRTATPSSDSASHPLSSLFSFTSSHPRVATVSPFGIVHAQSLGKTVIRCYLPRDYALQGGEGDDGLTGEVSVEVKFDSFVLVAGGGRHELLEGRALLAHVEGKNGERPGQPAFQPVSCQWSSDDDGLLLMPPLSYSPAYSPQPASPPAPVVGYSVVIVGRKPGRRSVQALVTVDASPVFGNASTFSYTLSVLVVPPLSVPCRASLLLPFNGTARLGSSLDATPGMDVSYRVMDADDDPTVDVVTIADGRATARARRAEQDAGDDAVVLVRATARAGEGEEEAGDAQSSSLAVSVRPVAQLFLRSSSPLTHPLCAGSGHTVSVLILDALARRFDNDNAWLGQDGLTVAVSDPDRLTVRVLGQATGAGGDGVVGVLELKSVESDGDTGLSAVVLRVGVKGDAVPPLYLQLFVYSPAEASSSCSALPPAALISFHLPLPYSEYPLRTQKRRELQPQLLRSLAAHLAVPASSLRITAIDPTTQRASILLLPALSTPSHHPHQLFLSSSLSQGDNAPMAIATRWKERLQSEGGGKEGWKDVEVQPVVLDADSLLGKEEDAGSVWTDERELTEWERSHQADSGGRQVAEPPPSSSAGSAQQQQQQPQGRRKKQRMNLTQSNPYEAIAMRIQESFMSSSSASSALTAPFLLSSLLTLLVLLLSLLYLYYRTASYGPGLTPSFALWLEDALRGLAGRRRALISPASSRAVGRGLNQSAAAVVG